MAILLKPIKRLGQTFIVRIDYEDRFLFKRKWQITQSGYVKSGTTINNKRIHFSLHRVILNAPKGMEVDHINGNRLDNRRKNLRLCTPIQNRQNTKTERNNHSGIKGVWFESPSWRARIYCNEKAYNLGRYPTKEAAAHAYKKAANRLYKDFARE